jgi:hypothetical protein
MALCPLYSPLTLLRPSVPSMVLYPPYDPLPSTALCHLNVLLSLLSPLWPSAHLQPSILSTALCLLYSPVPLYDPLSPLKLSVLSIALCLLYSPLSALQPSVCSTALCPLYGPLSPLWLSEKQHRQNAPLLFCQNLKGYRNLFCIRNNPDHHSCKMLSDNYNITIIN